MTEPTNPIDWLLEEHVLILGQADALRQAMARLEDSGAQGVDAEWETLSSFATLLAGKLAMHALKEDDALFPAVEAHIGTGGPTAAMREEHKEIHRRGLEYRAILQELHEVDHPKLEAESEAYQQMVEAIANGDGPDLQTIQNNVSALLALIHDHFEKEEQMLFPMTRNLLDEEALDAVTRHMRELEAGQA